MGSAPASSFCSHLVLILGTFTVHQPATTQGLISPRCQQTTDPSTTEELPTTIVVTVGIGIEMVATSAAPDHLATGARLTTDQKVSAPPPTQIEASPHSLRGTAQSTSAALLTTTEAALGIATITVATSDAPAPTDTATLPDMDMATIPESPSSPMDTAHMPTMAHSTTAMEIHGISGDMDATTRVDARINRSSSSRGVES